MNAKDIKLIESHEIELLQSTIDQLTIESKSKGLIILACDENQYDPDQFNQLLRKMSIPVFGGIFPGIIYGGKNYKQGSIVIGLDEVPRVNVIKNVSNIETQGLAEVYPEMEGESECNTVFVFVDGLCQNNARLIESLFISFGLEYNFIGAGCGSLSMNPTPCIITNEGLLTDAAVIAGSKMSGAIGTKHGWRSIAGPIRITGSDRNTLISLDFKPAYEVYKKILEEHSGKKVTRENFLEIAANYPVGITKLGTDKIIRDPVNLDEYGNILFLGDVPEGTFIHIMTSTPDDLIQAAGEAKTLVKSCEKNQDESFILFIDCITRLFLLGDRFKEELAIVNPNGLPMVGTLSMGEIANNKREYLELYNMTAVVGCFK